ncbi:unnamed protein product, partial [Urochloa humidicola]
FPSSEERESEQGEEAAGNTRRGERGPEHITKQHHPKTPKGGKKERENHAVVCSDKTRTRTHQYALPHLSPPLPSASPPPWPIRSNSFTDPHPGSAAIPSRLELDCSLPVEFAPFSSKNPAFASDLRWALAKAGGGFCWRLGAMGVVPPARLFVRWILRVVRLNPLQRSAKSR